MIYLGVDPGLEGGIAVLSEAGTIIALEEMPIHRPNRGRRQFDLAGIMGLVNRYGKQGALFVTVERLQPLPARVRGKLMGGTIANFNRGLARGCWESLLVALGVPQQLVNPRGWQSEMFVGTPKCHPKQRSIIAATRLFPEQTWLRTPRCRKAHDGFTDAALIGEWGRRRRVGRAA